MPIQTGQPIKADEVNDMFNTKENVSNKKTTISSTSDTEYPTSKAVYTALSAKENTSNKKTAVSSTSSDTEYPSAKAVYTALTAKENTSNKVISLSSASTDTQYPSAKAVHNNLTTGLAAKQDKIAAGTADNIVAYSGTAGTLNTLTRTTSVRASSSAEDTSIPTEKAVAAGLAAKANSADVQAMLPVGTILMYDGTGWQDNVTLVGWYQCDGNNGTPNLSDKFIKGAGTKAATGDGKMLLEVKHLPAHKHGITDKQHDHETKKLTNDRSEGSGGKDYTTLMADEANAPTQPNIKVASSYTGITETNNSTGGGQSFDVLPSYYSVIYIKRMA
ncbi:MAG: hypothetical protein LBQ83_05435 [Candidatus Margulisbacteria bacterium]|jgi:hypothetical protein|nr:hypothetical protein [Candidatus Margulisiibacteriota bacterium]